MNAPDWIMIVGIGAVLIAATVAAFKVVRRRRNARAGGSSRTSTADTRDPRDRKPYPYEK